MQQTQRLFEYRNQSSPRNISLRRISFRGHRRFRQFDIPIAKVVPEKVIETLDYAVEVVSFKLRVHFPGRPIQTRKYPTIVQRERRMIARKRIRDRLRALRIQQTKPRRIPNLVGEVAIRFDLLFVPASVRRSHRRQRQAGRIDAVLIKDLQRIDPVAFRFRHPLPVFVEHRAGNVNVVERFLADELQTGHHHARNPEKDDVPRCDENRSRIEGFQVLRLIRPAQRRERPQRRREPCVQHIFVLP